MHASAPTSSSRWRRMRTRRNVKAFDNWIATRTATTDPTQDPEVLTRTRALDGLKASERAAQESVEALDAQLLAVSQSLEANQQRVQALEDAASGAYERARFSREMRVFGIRLALTPPRCCSSPVGWSPKNEKQNTGRSGAASYCSRRLRSSSSWYRILPSYGGYVRYGVGIVASIVRRRLRHSGDATLSRTTPKRGAAERGGAPEVALVRRRGTPHQRGNLPGVRTGDCRRSAQPIQLLRALWAAFVRRLPTLHHSQECLFPVLPLLRCHVKRDPSTDSPFGAILSARSP